MSGSQFPEFFKMNLVKIDINNDLIFKELYIKSMEEFNIKKNFKNIVDAYYYFKRNSKLMYRVSLNNFSSFREFLLKQICLLVYKAIHYFTKFLHFNNILRRCKRRLMIDA